MQFSVSHAALAEIIRADMQLWCQKKAVLFLHQPENYSLGMNKQPPFSHHVETGTVLALSETGMHLCAE